MDTMAMEDDGSTASDDDAEAQQVGVVYALSWMQGDSSSMQQSETYQLRLGTNVLGHSKNLDRAGPKRVDIGITHGHISGCHAVVDLRRDGVVMVTDRDSKNKSRLGTVLLLPNMQREWHTGEAGFEPQACQFGSTTVMIRRTEPASMPPPARSPAPLSQAAPSAAGSPGPSSPGASLAPTVPFSYNESANVSQYSQQSQSQASVFDAGRMATAKLDETEAFDDLTGAAESEAPASNTVRTGDFDSEQQSAAEGRSGPQGQRESTSTAASRSTAHRSPKQPLGQGQVESGSESAAASESVQPRALAQDPDDDADGGAGAGPGGGGGGGSGGMNEGQTQAYSSGGNTPASTEKKAGAHSDSDDSGGDDDTTEVPKVDPEAAAALGGEAGDAIDHAGNTLLDALAPNEGAAENTVSYEDGNQTQAQPASDAEYSSSDSESEAEAEPEAPRQAPSPAPASSPEAAFNQAETYGEETMHYSERQSESAVSPQAPARASSAQDTRDEETEASETEQPGSGPKVPPTASPEGRPSDATEDFSDESPDEEPKPPEAKPVTSPVLSQPPTWPIEAPSAAKAGGSVDGDDGGDDATEDDATEDDDDDDDEEAPKPTAASAAAAPKARKAPRVASSSERSEDGGGGDGGAEAKAETMHESASLLPDSLPLMQKSLSIVPSSQPEVDGKDEFEFSSQAASAPTASAKKTSLLSAGLGSPRQQNPLLGRRIKKINCAGTVSSYDSGSGYTVKYDSGKAETFTRPQLAKYLIPAAAEQASDSETEDESDDDAKQLAPKDDEEEEEVVNQKRTDPDATVAFCDDDDDEEGIGEAAPRADPDVTIAFGDDDDAPEFGGEPELGGNSPAFDDETERPAPSPVKVSQEVVEEPSPSRPSKPINRVVSSAVAGLDSMSPNMDSFLQAAAPTHTQHDSQRLSGSRDADPDQQQAEERARAEAKRQMTQATSAGKAAQKARQAEPEELAFLKSANNSPGKAGTKTEESEEEEEEEAVLEQIVETRRGGRSGKGALEYLCAWAGSAEQTWEPKRAIQSSAVFKAYKPQANTKSPSAARKRKSVEPEPESSAPEPAAASSRQKSSRRSSAGAGAPIAGFSKGDVVKAKWNGQSKWYDGTITAVNDRQKTASILYSDGDSESGVVFKLIKLVEKAEADVVEQSQGTMSSAHGWGGSQQRARSTLLAADKDETKSEEQSETQPKLLGVGDTVTARWGGKSKWYDGTITAVNLRKSTVCITYADGDSESNMGFALVKLVKQYEVMDSDDDQGTSSGPKRKSTPQAAAETAPPRKKAGSKSAPPQKAEKKKPAPAKAAKSKPAVLGDEPEEAQPRVSSRRKGAAAAPAPKPATRGGRGAAKAKAMPQPKAIDPPPAAKPRSSAKAPKAAAKAKGKAGPKPKAKPAPKAGAKATPSNARSSRKAAEPSAPPPKKPKLSRESSGGSKEKGLTEKGAQAEASAFPLPRQIVVSFSSLEDDGDKDAASKKRLESMVKSLGGQITADGDKATHCVCAALKTTAKLLMAMGRGVPIVKPSWIQESESVQKWLPPDDFFVLETAFERKHKLVGLLKEAKARPLFSGMQIFVASVKGSNFDQRSKPELQRIAKCAGAKVIRSMPKKLPHPEEGGDGLPKLVLISDLKDKKAWQKHFDAGVPCYKAKWLSQSVMEQEMDWADSVNYLSY